MTAPVRAADVEVVTLRRARCHRQGCEYEGELRRSYFDANEDRGKHLRDHREQLAAENGQEALSFDG